MEDGVHVADLGEELVAEAFAFVRPPHQSGDVDELDRGGEGAILVEDLGEAVEARVGNGDDGTIGFDGAEGVAGDFGPGPAERVEDR